MTDAAYPPICVKCQEPITGEYLDVDEAMYDFETSYRIHPECWLVPDARS